MARQRGRKQPAAMAFILGSAACIAVVAVGSPALAEEEGVTYARVRHLADAMTISRTAEGELFAATLNAPILPGDRAWTEGNRAEIELADSSLLWLDEWTRVGFRSLTDVTLSHADNNLIVLEEGSIRISTYDPEDEAQAFQIDTEAGTIYLLSGGEFRIDASGGVTTLSSISGVAELSGDGGSILVRSGERSSVRSGRTPSEPRHFNTARLDQFDHYSEDRTLTYLRDQDDEIPVGVREEVPVEVHHYIHELSSYGRWYSVPSYGWVWRPAYHGAWGPYHDGYWTWCAGGWSWVSHEPWGWAPYHYGRWDHVASIGWVWIPGRTWSGAWVSFAVGPAYIGWAPLNYYNRPVFHDAPFVARGTVRGSDLHTRGWQFARHEQFSRRDRTRSQPRGERMPQNSEAVITTRLPHFDQTATAKRADPGINLVDSVRASGTPLPVAIDEEGREIPFRKLEPRSADVPAGSKRGTPQPRDLSIRSPAGSRRAVPGQQRGRPNDVPSAGRGGVAESSSGEERLHRAPRNLGMKLEQQSGVAPDRDKAPDRGGATDGRKNRVKSASPGESSDKVEKRRGHAVEQLFRGSRQRPAPMPLGEEARPGRSKASAPPVEKRSSGEGAQGERKKRPGGEGEKAGKRAPDRDRETAGSSSGKGSKDSAKDKSPRGQGKNSDRDRGRSR